MYCYSGHTHRHNVIFIKDKSILTTFVQFVALVILNGIKYVFVHLATILAGVNEIYTFTFAVAQSP